MAINQTRGGSSEQHARAGSQNHKSAGNTSNRGFASMDADQQREIASMGGQAAHEKGTAHEFSSEEARVAGSKGGKAAHERGTAHQFSSEEARAAGSKGGQSSGSRGQNSQSADGRSNQHMADIGRKGGQKSH